MSAALEAAQLTAKEALESKEAIQVAFEESERVRASEIEAAVQEVIRGYRRSTEFSTLLDKEVGLEMADLLYRFKWYNPGKKLNLNFIADPPPLPEGITEEMIEEYEGEDAAEEAPADPEGATAEGDGVAAEADEAAARQKASSRFQLKLVELLEMIKDYEVEDVSGEPVAPDTEEKTAV
ncbi:unnamed protein product [Prunus armeniaca]